MVSNGNFAILIVGLFLHRITLLAKILPGNRKSRNFVLKYIKWAYLVYFSNQQRCSGERIKIHPHLSLGDFLHDAHKTGVFVAVHTVLLSSTCRE